MGTKAVVSLILLALVGLAASAQAAAPTQPAAALPPDLVALEQKLLALQPISERISAQERLAAVSTADSPSSHSKPVFMTFDLEVGFKPPRAAYSLRLGHAKLAWRIVGHTKYQFESGRARLDGGRPWVREPHKVAAAPKRPGGPSSYLFPQPAKLIALINRRQSITEVGAQTVDGQAVTEFTASVDPVAATRLAPLWFSGEHEPVTGAMGLQLFLASNGLPVSIRLAGSSGRFEISSREDLAINVPVVVHAPPARLMISKARLKAIEQRRFEQQLAQDEQRLKRRCKHPSKRDLRLCKLVNRRPHRASIGSSPPRPPARTRAGK